MKSNTEMLLDIIYRKMSQLELYIDDLSNSLNVMGEEKIFLYESEVEQGKEKISFLKEIIEEVNSSDQGVNYLKEFLKETSKTEKGGFVLLKVSKVKILKELLKEYKIESRKRYWDNKSVGLNGLFNNELFCSIIKNKIDKYIYCNKVTQTKYKHLVAFLNEFLHEMETSNDPLKTLKHKIKLYEKYKKTEFIEIRKRKLPKIDIIKEILEEYKKEKKVCMRCK